MRGRITTLILPFLICLPLFSQSYGNEWIDYSKTYYKFYTTEDALHRVGYNALVGAGMANPVGADIQVFSGGQQIPIYVSTSGAFSPADYIEFYAKENDGSFDTQLYAQASHQSHDFKSLFSDEAAYFITKSASGQHLRYQTTPNSLTNLPAPESYFMHESTTVLFNIHHRGEPKEDIGGGKAWFADFEKGEGYTSPVINSSATSFVRLATKNQYTGSAPATEIELGVVGTDGAIGAYLDQHIQVFVRSFDFPNPSGQAPDIDDKFIDYDVRKYIFNVPQSQLGPIATDITLKALDGIDGSYSYQSEFGATYGKIRYPHTFDLENKKSFTFNVNVNSDKYFELSNFNGGSVAVLLDKTSNRRYNVNSVGGIYKVKIPYDPAFPGMHEFYISSTASNELETINASDLSTRNFTNFALTSNQGDYLMIYHPNLTQGAVDYVEEYRKYRQHGLTTSTGHSSPLNTFNVVTVDIEELYDQFAHGIKKHPLSVQNFVNYALNGPHAWPYNLEHMLILGKAVGYQDFRSNIVNFNNCLVPTYGQQPSDTKLSTLGPIDYRPQLGTGRIPASNGDQIRAYLDKLIEYEQLFVAVENDCSIQARKAMKQVLLATKGWGSGETNDFYQFTAGYGQSVQNNSTGWNVVEDMSDDGDHNPGPIRPEFGAAFEDGLAMIIYNGHSDGSYWEFNGHEDDGTGTLWPTNFNNEGKYPFILSNSCFVGQIHRPGGESQAEDYVLSDNRGSVGFLATLALAYPSFLDIFSKRFINNMSLYEYGSTAGQLIKNTIADIYVPNNSGIKATCLEFTYAGDPAVEMYNFDYPSYHVDDVNIIGGSPGVSNIEVGVYNTGKAVPGQTLQLQVTSTSANGIQTVHPIQSVPPPSYFDSYTIAVPTNGQLGPFSYSVELDPNDLIQEDCEAITSVSFSGRAYLQGYYGNGQMSTNLNSNNLIPFAQPYNSPPYNYTGTEVVSAIPSGTVDWVLLELRSASNESTVIDRKAGFIRSDGTITDINGTPSVSFNAPGGSYYVVLHHRGHVSVMSASPISLPASGTTDFTTSSITVKGSNQLKLVNGAYVMRAGDFDGSGTVNFSDFVRWLQNNNILSAYLSVDVDGNGTVNFTDFILWLSNNNHIRYSGI